MVKIDYISDYIANMSLFTRLLDWISYIPTEEQIQKEEEEKRLVHKAYLDFWGKQIEYEDKRQRRFYQPLGDIAIYVVMFGVCSLILVIGTRHQH